MLKYFNGTTISTFTVPSLPVLFVNLNLNLNYSESLILLFGSPLQYCHKRPDVFEQLSVYSIKLYISITISESLTLSI